MKGLCAVVLAGAALVAGCRDESELERVPAAPMPSAAEGESLRDLGFIAFVVERAGNSDVVLVGADGRRRRELTRRLPGNHYCPSFSPDGSRLAMLEQADGRSRVLVLSLDGRLVRRFSSPGPSLWCAIQWSANGRSIALQVGDPANLIYLADVDSGAVRLLAEDARDFAWSPDGERVSLTRASGLLTDAIAVGKLGGTSPRVILDFSEGPSLVGAISWSPDGRAILFEHFEDRGLSSTQHLGLVSARGGAHRDLTQVGSDHQLGSWSPDGSLIAADTGSHSGIDVIRVADGRIATRISEGDMPRWAPDGSWLAIVVNRVDGETARGALYLIHPDGTDLRRLTPDGLFISDLAWGPAAR